jgi:membrane protease YdiL (CAAX protease family)
VTESVEAATPSAFSDVRARYIVLVWVGLAFYLPGSSLILSSLDFNWTWYWWDVAMFYLGHFYFFLAILLFGVLAGKVPIKTCIGRQPTLADVRGGVELTAFLFVASMATLYVTYYPLSFVVPSFVEYWYINTPYLVYADAGTYPVLPNLLNLLSLCVIGPVLEEVAFRGIIMPRWARKWGLRAGILSSSTAFAVVHTDPLGAFLFGIGMSVLYLKAQSLVLPILCHGLSNLVAWLIELGYLIAYGSEHVYTLQEFRDGWPWGLGCAVIVVLWVALYFRRPKSSVRWTLPVT